MESWWKKIEEMDSQVVRVIDKITLDNFWVKTGSTAYIFNIKAFHITQLLMERNLFQKDFTEETPLMLATAAVLEVNAFKDIKGSLCFL